MDYRAMAREEALRAGVDPDVFTRLVENESSFNPAPPDAGAGAVGLSQLLPSTARELGVDPYDPRQNLQGGARYLKQQYDRYGDYYNAAAAYTAGAGNVDTGNVNDVQKAYALRVAGSVPAVSAGAGYAMDPARAFSGGARFPADRSLYSKDDLATADPSADTSDQIDTSDLSQQDMMDWMQTMEDERAAQAEYDQQSADLTALYGGDTTTGGGITQQSVLPYDPNGDTGVGDDNNGSTPGGTDTTDTTGTAGGAAGTTAAATTDPNTQQPKPAGTGITDVDPGTIAALLAGGGKKPSPLSTNEALDRIGIALYGKPFGGATAAEKNAMWRSLGKIDEQSLIQYGKVFADLPPTGKGSQDELLAGAKAEPVTPTEAEGRQAAAQAKSDLRHAESLRLFDERRTALWARQDRLRQEAIQRALDKQFLTAAVHQPTPARAPAAAARAGSSALSFSALARVIPTDDLQQLISAWEGGSLGLTAVSPIRLQRMMAAVPIANSAADFLATLQTLWVKEGMPSLDATSRASRRTPSAVDPRIPSIRRIASPQPGSSGARTPIPRR